MFSVLVLGAGVSGLTTALTLSRNGFRTIAIAEDFSPNVTSSIAGALWEFPPAVCGYYRQRDELRRAKNWCIDSYHAFNTLAESPETGVVSRISNFYFRHPIEHSRRDFGKANELKSLVRGFEHDVHLATKNGIATDFGIKDAYRYVAPTIDMSVYLDWLMKQAKNSGVQFHSHKIDGNILEQEESLRKKYDTKFLVNCSGLGSAKLVSDPDVFPLRGALVRFKSDAVTRRVLSESHCISQNDCTKEQDIIYIVPRSDNTVLLGGLAEPNVFETNIGLDNYKPVQNIVNRCKSFLPVLDNLCIEDCPVLVGLRPVRRGGVRIGIENGTRVIHNYGHGGAGVSLSWGCANEILRILNICS